MRESELTACRLCLVTPPEADPVDLALRLDEALAGGDVASLFISTRPDLLQAIAERLVPVAQRRGVAAIVHGPPETAQAVGADGLHVDGGVEALRTALGQRPRMMVGAGGVASRHEAMSAGELEPDYLFFGRLDGDADSHIARKVLDLAEWWASMFVIPAVVMGGRTFPSVRQAAEAGIEFVALGRAVWEHPAGPRAAVAEANQLLAAPADPVE